MTSKFVLILLKTAFFIVATIQIANFGRHQIEGITTRSQSVVFNSHVNERMVLKSKLEQMCSKAERANYLWLP
jgi:hypothetical protein